MPLTQVYTTVMSITFTFQNSSFKVHQVSLDGTPWFRGNDVALVLGYSRPRSTIRDHVDEDDGRQLCEVCSSALASDVDRNDKSRVCEPGSVRVIGRRQIEMYSRLIHTVDHIEGRLREGMDAFDAFLSHAWAVTVTGAPKLWAMRFIEDHAIVPAALLNQSLSPLPCWNQADGSCVNSPSNSAAASSSGDASGMVLRWM